MDFLNRRLPAFLDTGLNWVHVRDVAVGHVLAAEKGRLGQRYILGHAQGNWTLQQTLATLEKITGLPAPRIKMPYWLALGVAQFSEGIAFFTGRAPQATLAGVRMARHKMWYQSRQSHPRTRPAPDRARTGLHRRRQLVPRQWVCQMART